MAIAVYILIVFAAFGGFLLSAYIHHKKTRNEKMLCPIGSDCDKVIHSEYSYFFGIPVELLGLVYYGLIGLTYGLFILLPELALPIFIFSVLVLTTIALLFSLYLTFIQAFVLKEWCTWCLISAGFCLIIFIFALLGSEEGLIGLLAGHHDFIVLVHLAGAAIGLGAATVTDVLFFKFLKDFKISEFEAGVLKILSQVIWFALAIVLISGIGLYLPEISELHETPKFLVKMIVFLVIIINGSFLNLLITPHLVKISFGERHHHKEGELHHIRKLAFALGAISIISWYSAFILGALREITLGFGALLAIYLSIVLVGIIASQLFERYFVIRSGE